MTRTQGFSCLGFGSLTRSRGRFGRRMGFCGIVSDVRDAEREEVVVFAR